MKEKSYKRPATRFMPAQISFSAYPNFLFALVVAFLFGACNSQKEELIDTWTLPGHSHYFDLREDGGYSITGVDGYRETGEWLTANGTVLLRNRLGTDTLWFSINGKNVQLEEHKNGITLSLGRAKEKVNTVEGEELLDYLLNDTMAYFTPSGTIESTPIFFHEDALLDLASRTEKLWRLKQFKDEWFLGIEALTVIEYSRITGFTENGIELEYLDRRSYSLRKTYLRKYQ